MRRFPLIIGLILLSAALPAAAQDLLPASFANWSAPAAAERVRAEALEGLVGGDAAILREYGVVAAERRAYARGTETLSVVLYRTRDPSGAYGAFTYLRPENMLPGRVTQYSALAPKRGLVVAGNLLLDVAADNVPHRGGDLKALVAQLSPHVDKSPIPTIGQYLPARGLVPNSERYVLGPLALNRLHPLGNGDWLGFADGAEAELARYRINGQEITLLVALYPTPQVAARKMEELGRWFKLNPSADTVGDSSTPIFARRKGSLLSLVASTRSPELANALLDQIKHETQVTWNEPGHRLTDPNLATLIVSAILGTGTLLLFALVAGIGFGGIRIVVKYFLPGKVFDRPAHVEILQLGLTSKPIEAKDFY